MKYRAKQTKFVALLEKKNTQPEMIVKEVVKDRKLIPILLQGFDSDKTPLKFTSARILVAVSTQYPNIIYPYFTFFRKQLCNPNNILKWNAMGVLAQLTKVDRRKKFDALFKQYFGMLSEGSIIAASTVVKNVPVIVKNKPYLERKITQAILNIDALPLPTAECRNIVKGHVIMALDQYFPLVKQKAKVLKFIKKEVKNKRAATRKKAEDFLKKWQ